MVLYYKVLISFAGFPAYTPFLFISFVTTLPAPITLPLAIFTGRIDEFFDFYHGALDYRSLRFETSILDKKDFQGNAIVNYTEREVPYTRIIEHKHFEFSKEDDALRREYMQAYHACISFIDAQVKLVFDALEESGHWEDTIVIFTSDHGYHLGDHFLWGKVTLFDIGAKVPFIIHAPGLTKPGTRSEAMVELIDIYPTLAQLTGLTPPEYLQGNSLRPLLDHPERLGKKKYAYSIVTRGKDMGYALRNQRWRYGKWPDGEELYNLTRDPEEKKNLAGRDDLHPRLEEFRKILKEKQALATSAR